MSSTTIQIGRKLIPAEHIALVEPFDPAAAAGINTEKDFRARVVLIDRDSVLTEESPAIFAEVYGFRMLATDNVATNPAVRFSVETFEPAEGFKPSKPFMTRLLWRDGEGNAQSKLLLSAPEVVLAVAVKGEAESVGVSGEADAIRSEATSSRRRRTRRRAPAAAPA
jgi:hypothetical protein